MTFEDALQNQRLVVFRIPCAIRQGDSMFFALFL